MTEQEHEQRQVMILLIIATIAVAIFAPKEFITHDCKVPWG